MKPFISMIILSILLVQPTYGEGLIKKWLDIAVEELRVEFYSGDVSSAKRRLSAILEEDPTHLEALWQLAYTNHLARPKNWRLLNRDNHLQQVGPQLKKIIKLAHAQQNVAFAHYVKAWEGLLYNAFPSALTEINNALALQQDSVRYLMLKGRILVAQGDWEDRDDAIEEGIRMIQQAWDYSKQHPSPFYKEENFHFRLAHSLWHLKERPWKEVTYHYEQAIKNDDAGTRLPAYAWTNVSKAYRLQGQCKKAKDAAEKALAILEMNSAERQKQYAEFCLEMKQLGISLPVRQTARTAD